MLDDLGWADLGCYGSSFYETPRLDSLAAQGVRFTDAYASCPVCSPTRASLLTGKYPATVGITNYIPGNAWGKLMGVPYFHELPKSETTLAQALGNHGYQTWHVGKWHLGPKGHWPEDFGFDRNIAGKDWGAPKNGYFPPWGIETLNDGPEGEYLTDRLTDEAVGLIRRRDADRPFFLHFAHYAVHTPIQAPAHLIRKYEQKARDLGLDQRDPIEVGEQFSCLHKKDEQIERRKFQSDATYAAMIENMDTNIGRVLDVLDDAGLADDTIVLFYSDNGGLSISEGSPTCNAPLSEGKGWMYDGGVREPLLIRWPAVITPGRVTDTPITTPDFYPTLLEAAGIPPMPEQHVDGISFLPLLRGNTFDRGEPIYWHYPHYSNQGCTPACSIRDGDWKLIEFFEDDRLELYNLREDIGEARNLAATHPKMVLELHRKLREWQGSVEAKIPEPNPDYDAMRSGEIPSPDARGIIPGSDH